MERSTSAPAAAPGEKLDGGVRSAAGVASFLRSAIRRRGELFRAVGADESEIENEKPGDWRERETPAVGSDTQSSSASAEAASPPWSAASSGAGAADRGAAASGGGSDERFAADALSPISRTASASPRRYEVIYDPMDEEDGGLDDATDSEDPAEPVLRQQSGCSVAGGVKVEFVDVLLQADCHGLGLNLSLATKQTGDAIVVHSFRRLHSSDVGPAEACKKICVGDELSSIDGVRITSIKQLHAKVHSVPDGSFLLLRFLRTNDPYLYQSSRRAFSHEESEAQILEGKASPDIALDVEHAIQDNPQVAALIRSLTETNQRLQEQLLASMLKQDELNIQLDQLYSLYARTQVDSSLSSFSLSKSLRPLVWRNGNRSSDEVGNHALGIDRSAYSSKVLLEIEDAVGAEYERLRRNFELQYSIDKKQLERRFAEKAQELEATASKKVAMLQAGYEHATRRFDEMIAPGNLSVHSCSCHLNSLEECEDSYPAELPDSADRKLQEIMKVLDDYKYQQAERDAKLLELELQESKPAPPVANGADLLHLHDPKHQVHGANSTCAA